MRNRLEEFKLKLRTSTSRKLIVKQRDLNCHIRNGISENDNLDRYLLIKNGLKELDVDVIEVDNSL